MHFHLNSQNKLYAPSKECQLATVYSPLKIQRLTYRLNSIVMSLCIPVNFISETNIIVNEQQPTGESESAAINQARAPSLHNYEPAKKDCE